MPPVNGETLKMGYVLQQLLQRRCQVFKPDRLLVNGDPTGVEWEMVVDNCPFWHLPAYGFDEPGLVGRQDQVLVFTTERLYFPIDADINQGYFVRDISLRRDGTPVKNHGRYFACRGIPTWYEELEDIDEAHEVVIATMEFHVHAGIERLAAAWDANPPAYWLQGMGARLAA